MKAFEHVRKSKQPPGVYLGKDTGYPKWWWVCMLALAIFTVIVSFL